MDGKPAVSVIMPVFNTEKYVAEAIESVFSQTFRDLELICIDDGSSDRSVEVIKSFGDRVLLLQNEQNCGIGKSRNRGMAVAKGRFIAFIDADDIWRPEKLEKQLKQFEKDSSLSVCFSMMQCFLSPELPEEIRKIRFCPTEPTPGYIAGTVILTREVMERVGAFNEQLRIGEFIDWYTKAQDAGFKSAKLDDVLYLRRIHETNTGVNERPSRLDYLKVARSVLARRKQD